MNSVLLKAVIALSFFVVCLTISYPVLFSFNQKRIEKAYQDGSLVLCNGHRKIRQWKI